LNLHTSKILSDTLRCVLISFPTFCFI